MGFVRERVVVLLCSLWKVLAFHVSPIAFKIMSTAEVMHFALPALMWLRYLGRLHIGLHTALYSNKVLNLIMVGLNHCQRVNRGLVSHFIITMPGYI